MKYLSLIRFKCSKYMKHTFRSCHANDVKYIRYDNEDVTIYSVRKYILYSTTIFIVFTFVFKHIIYGQVSQYTMYIRDTTLTYRYNYQ
jgi:hypothetical protein